MALADDIEDSSSTNLTTASEFFPEDYNIICSKYWRLISLESVKFVQENILPFVSILSDLQAFIDYGNTQSL